MLPWEDPPNYRNMDKPLIALTVHNELNLVVAIGMLHCTLPGCPRAVDDDIVSPSGL